MDNLKKSNGAILKAVQKPGDHSDVAGLLDGLRRSKNFKQLAAYSLQCLEKVICSPNVGWEVRILHAFRITE